MLHDANVVFAIEAAFAMVTKILLTPMSPNDSPPQRDWQSNFCEPTVIQTNAWWDGIAGPPANSSHAGCIRGICAKEVAEIGYGKILSEDI